jgi:hypothetical protein
MIFEAFESLDTTGQAFVGIMIDSSPSAGIRREAPKQAAA